MTRKEAQYLRDMQINRDTNSYLYEAKVIEVMGSLIDRSVYPGMGLSMALAWSTLDRHRQMRAALKQALEDPNTRFKTSTRDVYLPARRQNVAGN